MDGRLNQAAKLRHILNPRCDRNGRDVLFGGFDENRQLLRIRVGHRGYPQKLTKQLNCLKSTADFEDNSVFYSISSAFIGIRLAATSLQSNI